MSNKDIFVLFTMDCEPARPDVTTHAAEMSASGPADYLESERAIRAYCETVKAHGFATTLFAHPEIAEKHRALLLELQDAGACLGLHLHPYKFGDGRYRHDLGAYAASEQQKMLEEAVAVWEEALGQKPRYFRAGYFSANDNTFRVLQALGFRGGSLSLPGRVLPEHCSVWAGAALHTHRAHLSFRQLEGNSDFVEIPVAVDLARPVQVGTAGEQGYEWPYVPAQIYDHRQVIGNILDRFQADSPRYPAVVMDTHNDQDYANPGHPSSVNLALILDCIRALCAERGLRPVSATAESLCDLVLSDDVC
jgi:peptidoglycan/xylan/chitin deacetylase (PgdA/CDA1 family)